MSGTGEITATFDLSECETHILANGVRLVTHRAAPESEEVRIASLRRDEDHWWRGFWNREWHFADSESVLRELLDEDLRAGRVELF